MDSEGENFTLAYVQTEFFSVSLRNMKTFSQGPSTKFAVHIIDGK